MDAANETWQLTVAPVGGFRPSWIALATLAAAVSAALATALVFHLARGLCDCRGGGRVRPADDAERRLRDAEQRLRERLGITYRQGYEMGDERPPRPRWPPAFSWLGGARVPLAGMFAHMVNEMLIHGNDMARAVNVFKENALRIERMTREQEESKRRAEEEPQEPQQQQQRSQ